MSIINSQPRIGAAGQSTGQYKIERSLRFNSADSAYLNRTPASAGNRKTWTWSGWVKRGLVDTNYRSFFANGNAVDNVMFWNDTSLAVRNFNGTSYDVRTTQLFRDPSAWYHLVIAMDTTQATASNRIKIYVNGVQVTAFAVATYPSQNYDTGFNTTTVQYLGYNEYNYFDGYMTEVNFIDGLALTPASFGQTNSATGVWEPRQYTGPYGTNGFYLNFSDNSGTTSTTLGKDYSGNGNNWTPNNFSVTAGAGNDSLVDTPTPYGTDTGAGGEVRGNYATLNPLKQTGASLTNGNLQFTKSSGAGASLYTIHPTLLVSSGKWYFEVTPTAINTNGSLVGIVGSDVALATYTSLSSMTGNIWAYRADAYKVNNGSSASYGNTWTTNDVIGVAVDMDNGKIWWSKNGTWQASGDPAAGTNAAYTNVSGSVGPLLIDQGISGTFDGSINAGQRAFAYTAPSGFKALCTQNLPTPTIGATSATQAGKYFNTIIWTGTDTTASRSFTGVGFQPDFVWTKIRSNSGFEHLLYDAVRGAGNDKELSSNSTGAEGYLNTDTQGYLSSFNSDGFSSTAGTIQNEWFNRTGYTYVAWNWNAGGSNQTISVSQYSSNVPSIASTVSASTLSGFSIVTMTYASVAGTVGHGLGATPSMIIVKRRDSTGAWVVAHSGLTNMSGYYLLLNATDAQAAASWGGSPTSTVFNMSNNIFASGDYVAYCFAPIAGYSAFGSYTGNGSADGPFVYTGFKPAWVLIKQSSAAGEGWRLIDTARSTYNQANRHLVPNSSAAESTETGWDMLSNGFKLRNADAHQNGNGATYIYAAFAANPFKFSLAA